MNKQISFEDIQSLPAFENMPAQQIKQLAPYMVRRTYAPGQFIFLEGDEVNELWFVAEGRVRIIKQSINGRVQGLCMMDKGKCFGSCPLFEMEKNPATAQAVDTVTLYVLPEEYIKHFSEKEPELIAILLQIYSRRLGHLAKMSEVLGTWTVNDRINDCLIMYATETEGKTIVKLTHEKIATLSGTVREVVTRHLASLESQGIVALEPGYVNIIKKAEISRPCAF